MRTMKATFFERDKTYSYNDAQVIGMVRFSLITGIVCGSLGALFIRNLFS